MGSYFNINTGINPLRCIMQLLFMIVLVFVIIQQHTIVNAVNVSIETPSTIYFGVEHNVTFRLTNQDNIATWLPFDQPYVVGLYGYIGNFAQESLRVANPISIASSFSAIGRWKQSQSNNNQHHTAETYSQCYFIDEFGLDDNNSNTAVLPPIPIGGIYLHAEEYNSIMILDFSKVHNLRNSANNIDSIAVHCTNLLFYNQFPDVDNPHVFGQGYIWEMYYNGTFLDHQRLELMIYSLDYNHLDENNDPTAGQSTINVAFDFPLSPQHIDNNTDFQQQQQIWTGNGSLVHDPHTGKWLQSIEIKVTHPGVYWLNLPYDRPYYHPALIGDHSASVFNITQMPVLLFSSDPNDGTPVGHIATQHSTNLTGLPIPDIWRCAPWREDYIIQDEPYGFAHQGFSLYFLSQLCSMRGYISYPIVIWDTTRVVKFVHQASSVPLGGINAPGFVSSFSFAQIMASQWHPSLSAYPIVYSLLAGHAFNITTGESIPKQELPITQNITLINNPYAPDFVLPPNMIAKRRINNNNEQEDAFILRYAIVDINTPDHAFELYHKDANVTHNEYDKNFSYMMKLKFFQSIDVTPIIYHFQQYLKPAYNATTTAPIIYATFKLTFTTTQDGQHHNFTKQHFDFSKTSFRQENPYIYYLDVIQNDNDATLIKIPLAIADGMSINNEDLLTPDDHMVNFWFNLDSSQNDGFVLPHPIFKEPVKFHFNITSVAFCEYSVPIDNFDIEDFIETYYYLQNRCNPDAHHIVPTVSIIQENYSADSVNLVNLLGGVNTQHGGRYPNATLPVDTATTIATGGGGIAFISIMLLNPIFSSDFKLGLGLSLNELNIHPLRGSEAMNYSVTINGLRYRSNLDVLIPYEHVLDRARCDFVFLTALTDGDFSVYNKTLIPPHRDVKPMGNGYVDDSSIMGEFYFKIPDITYKPASSPLVAVLTSCGVIHPVDPARFVTSTTPYSTRQVQIPLFIPYQEQYHQDQSLYITPWGPVFLTPARMSTHILPYIAQQLTDEQQILNDEQQILSYENQSSTTTATTTSATIANNDFYAASITPLTIQFDGILRVTEEIEIFIINAVKDALDYYMTTSPTVPSLLASLNLSTLPSNTEFALCDLRYDSHITPQVHYINKTTSATYGPYVTPYAKHSIKTLVSICARFFNETTDEYYEVFDYHGVFDELIQYGQPLGSNLSIIQRTYPFWNRLYNLIETQMQLQNENKVKLIKQTHLTNHYLIATPDGTTLYDVNSAGRTVQAQPWLTMLSSICYKRQKGTCGKKSQITNNLVSWPQTALYYCPIQCPIQDPYEEKLPADLQCLDSHDCPQAYINTYNGDGDYYRILSNNYRQQMARCHPQRKVCEFPVDLFGDLNQHFSAQPTTTTVSTPTMQQSNNNNNIQSPSTLFNPNGVLTNYTDSYLEQQQIEQDELSILPQCHTTSAFYGAYCSVKPHLHNVRLISINTANNNDNNNNNNGILFNLTQRTLSVFDYELITTVHEDDPDTTITIANATQTNHTIIQQDVILQKDSTLSFLYDYIGKNNSNTIVITFEISTTSPTNNTYTKYDGSTVNYPNKQQHVVLWSKQIATIPKIKVGNNQIISLTLPSTYPTVFPDYPDIYNPFNFTDNAVWNQNEVVYYDVRKNNTAGDSVTDINSNTNIQQKLEYSIRFNTIATNSYTQHTEDIEYVVKLNQLNHFHNFRIYPNYYLNDVYLLPSCYGVYTNTSNLQIYDTCSAGSGGLGQCNLISGQCECSNNTTSSTFDPNNNCQQQQKQTDCSVLLQCSPIGTSSCSLTQKKCICKDNYEGAYCQTIKSTITPTPGGGGGCGGGNDQQPQPTCPADKLKCINGFTTHCEDTFCTCTNQWEGMQCSTCRIQCSGGTGRGSPNAVCNGCKCSPGYSGLGCHCHIYSASIDINPQTEILPKWFNFLRTVNQQKETSSSSTNTNIVSPLFDIIQLDNVAMESWLYYDVKYLYLILSEYEEQQQHNNNQKSMVSTAGDDGGNNNGDIILDVDIIKQLFTDAKSFVEIVKNAFIVDLNLNSDNIIITKIEFINSRSTSSYILTDTNNNLNMNMKVHYVVKTNCDNNNNNADEDFLTLYQNWFKMLSTPNDGNNNNNWFFSYVKDVLNKQNFTVETVNDITPYTCPLIDDDGLCIGEQPPVHVPTVDQNNNAFSTSSFITILIVVLSSFVLSYY